MRAHADAEWHCGASTLRGAVEIERFLRHKFERQLEHHVSLSLFCADGRRVAAHAVAEWRAAAAPADADADAAADGGWWRTRCNEQYEFADDGTLTAQDTCAKDVPITDGDRMLKDAAAQFAALAEKHGLLPRPAPASEATPPGGAS
jgi:nuclear transport factor 2 (NTF2) superfamily protein